MCRARCESSFIGDGYATRSTFLHRSRNIISTSVLVCKNKVWEKKTSTRENSSKTRNITFYSLPMSRFHVQLSVICHNCRVRQKSLPLKTYFPKTFFMTKYFLQTYTRRHAFCRCFPNAYFQTTHFKKKCFQKIYMYVQETPPEEEPPSCHYNNTHYVSC